MIVQPQSNLKLLANVPFTPEQTHQIMFASESAQLQYMNAHVTAGFTNQSYVKKDDYIRLEVNPDAVYNCSYVMWQNVGFGNKWFYGFITDIQYVSPECCGIRIQVDYYQSWLFQFTVGKCYVEREHVSNDAKGRNITPEGLETGPYVIGNETEYTMSLGTIIYILPAEGVPNGKRINNVYTATEATGFRSGNEGAANDLLGMMLKNPEKVAAVVMGPDNCISSGGSVNTYLTSASLAPPSTINGYAPKNNKLFCYPYCFAEIDNYSGDSSELRFELNNGGYGNLAFTIAAYPVPKPGMIMYPTSYKGSAENIEDGVTYTNFPVCAWAGETFSSWMAFNGGTAALSMIGGAIGTVTAAASNNIPGAISSLTAITGTMQQIEKQRTHNMALHGSVGSAAINAGLGKIGFRFRSYTITAEMAAEIDDYFTRFGYKVCRYKTPNLTSRTSFNFVKTVDAYVNGSIPNDALREIASMFDNGVTLWHTTDVGNYSLTNTIVEGGGENE